MASHFDLLITADYPTRTAELRLQDEHGSQLAYRQTDFKTISVSRQQGLFDLRSYLTHYVERGREAAGVAEIGVCIAEQVLGEEIFRLLWQSEAQRTLRIQLPGATDQENHLAAALARVPWEIARPAADKPTLGQRNLVVRVVHDVAAPATQPLELAPDECVRVLFVFAESRGSNPLAARLERQQLRRLLEQEIYPQRRIVADFLTHGVTRQRLTQQIEDRGGYHFVHWSGHGHLNLLELAQPGGDQDLLSGEELLDLFVQSGGFIPRLFFLSACHSGDILRVKDWNDFLAVAHGHTPGTKQVPDAPTKDIPLDEQPGYTGTAHALLQRGVPSVVAMRYAVGDDYARELAVEFYRALLAHTQPKHVAAALTMARQSLFDPKQHDVARFDPCDHATPVLYGDEDHGLTLPAGRSPGLDTRDPRLHQIVELTAAAHEHFVGRTWELAGLGADFIGSSAGVEVKTVAVITGLGGMGKSALCAESLSLWELRFEWVLLYQAKPNALGFEATLRDIHTKLYAELGRYHDHVQLHRADAIYRAADAEFTGPERLERLTRNLIRALRDEPILLVLDNFETNLKPLLECGDSSPLSLSNSLDVAGKTSEKESGDKSPHSKVSCQDPAWDRCLALLAAELVGTASRVLITCRRPLAALVDGALHAVRLGPLPAGEAALYLREHAGLSKLAFSGDAGERALALRLLNASRFHPLLMDRLARLATGGPALRERLLQALDALEQTKDFAQLPALFATDPGDAKELAYLNDALATSLDQLIHEASPDARRLLWMIAVANEPVELDLLRDVWRGGDGPQTAQLRQLKQMLDMLPSLPPETQEKLNAMPPELREMLDALPPAAPVRPDPTPLLRHLLAVGLATEERSGPEDDNPELTCHELVRERIRAWMQDREQDRADLTENAIRLAYAERLEAVFKALQHQNMTAALEAGSRALVYCVQAAAYDRLGNFASQVVISTSDPRLLAGLLFHLEAATEFAPEGKLRWRCLRYLADALVNAGYPDASLSVYERAADQARIAADGECANDGKTWADVGWISGNWANALFNTGELSDSRARRIESVEALRKAARPAIEIIAGELETLRIDIMQGQVAQALPQVEARLAQVEAWWRQQHFGLPVSAASDSADLAHLLISALSITIEVHFAQQEWNSALRRIEAIMEVKRAIGRTGEDIAEDRMNRAHVLGWLRQFGEARQELEAGLRIFQNSPEKRARTLTLLATLFSQQDDVDQAITQERRALALFEQLPLPRSRAASHSNLDVYLQRSGTTSVVAESSAHRMAALIYRLIAELQLDLPHSLRNYVFDFRRAHAADTPLTVPRLSDLLADPAFHPLADWLRLRQADPAEVQAAVDQFLDHARQLAKSAGTR